MSEPISFHLRMKHGLHQEQLRHTIVVASLLENPVPHCPAIGSRLKHSRNAILSSMEWFPCSGRVQLTCSFSKLCPKILIFHASKLIGISFEEFFLVHTPFLEPVQSLSGLVDRSPLLFWTIVMVSCQLHRHYSFLYNDMVTVHRQLLSQEIHSALQSLEAVQAILVVCTWPIPQVHHTDDPCWEHIGLAINAAIRLHCHRPLPLNSPIRGWKGLGTVTANDLNVSTQHKTWLACVDLSTS